MTPMGSLSRVRGAAISLILARMRAIARRDGQRWHQSSRPPRLHESVVEAQEVEAFGPLPQIHDPGLLRMQGEFQGLCYLLEPSQGCLRVRFGSTQNHTIVRVANEGAEVACLLCPECVKGMTVAVRHQRRDRPALRHARGLGEGPALHQHPSAYPQTQQPDLPTIADPAADESQKQVLVETPVVVLEIQVHHPPRALVDGLPDLLQRLMGAALGSEAEGRRQELASKMGSSTSL